MGRRASKGHQHSKSPGDRRGAVSGVRIIGGRLRGSELPFTGQANTRPMKDRTREAIFNLVGPAVKGRIVFDLFAGTGAMAIESISRGAKSAVMLERHFPTANSIRKCATELGIASQVDVVASDTFHWANNTFDPIQYSTADPWLIFCSPPYDLYVENNTELLALIGRMTSSAPGGSLVVIEADNRFDTDSLPGSIMWDIRAYRPAVVALGRIQ
jgi:16S rRNA (guanine966-N2)-methyltransferase